jgi:hypothetical protein
VTAGQAMISVGLQCRQSRRGRRGDRELAAGFAKSPLPMLKQQDRLISATL